MRSIPLLAATTVVLAAAWSCGGGGGVGPNTPVANFTVGSCTANTACQFSNTSTPATGLTYAWNFGDNTNSTEKSPAHTYTAAGSYSVSLSVKDASSATNVKASTVTVAAGTNQPPTASFTLPTTCSAGTPCGFHSTSTDVDGTIASAHWSFGDQGVAETPDATHTYKAAGTYTVTLTVTDDKGATSVPVPQQLIVGAPASQSCTTTGKVVNCSLGMTEKVTVKVTLVSHKCELPGNDLISPTPVYQTVFFNLCNGTDGAEYTIKDGVNQPLVFQVGDQLALRFSQGTPGPNDPPAGDPGIRVTGGYPTWTLNVDDGGAAATPGEPDFNDAVLTVQATKQ